MKTDLLVNGSDMLDEIRMRWVKKNQKKYSSRKNHRCGRWSFFLLRRQVFGVIGPGRREQHQSLEFLQPLIPDAGRQPFLVRCVKDLKYQKHTGYIENFLFIRFNLEEIWISLPPFLNNNKRKLHLLPTFINTWAVKTLTQKTPRRHETKTCVMCALIHKPKISFLAERQGVIPFAKRILEMLKRLKLKE
jgi:hypothetical protein